MQMLMHMRIILYLAAVLTLALTGCAGKHVNKTLQAEEMLAAAGFQLKMADTPAKVERIGSIPQKRVVWGKIKDREMYIWADAAGCHCYYAGTRQNYEQLLQNQQEAHEDRHTYLYQDQRNDPLPLGPGWDD